VHLAHRGHVRTFVRLWCSVSQHWATRSNDRDLGAVRGFGRLGSFDAVQKSQRNLHTVEVAGPIPAAPTIPHCSDYEQLPSRPPRLLSSVSAPVSGEKSGFCPKTLPTASRFSSSNTWS